MSNAQINLSPAAAVPNSEPRVADELRKDSEGKPRPIYKIQLLRGRHADRQGKFNKDDKGPHNAFPSGRFATRVFQANVNQGVFPEFESTVDLAGKEYNPEGYAPKFKRVDGPPPVQVVDSTQRRQGETVADYIERITKLSAELLKTAKETAANELAAVEKMSQEQLIQYCEDNELDYSAIKPGDLKAFRNFVKAHVERK